MNINCVLRRHFSALSKCFAIVGVQSLSPNCAKNYTHICFELLSSCKDLDSLLRIHARLIVLGLEANAFTSTNLINFYASFQRCDFSRMVFNCTPNPGRIVWNSIIRAYARSNQHREAITVYHQMLEKSIQPDKYTFTFVLKACAGISNLQESILIHREVCNRGLDSDLFISTALIDVYCKVGDLEIARGLFDKMPMKDIVTWNAMIDGLSQYSGAREAMTVFSGMQFEGGLKPNPVSLLNLFPAICKLMDIGACKCLHAYAIRREFPRAVMNGLIDVYAKCGYATVGRLVFDTMSGRDDVSWGTMMAGYAYNGCLVEVLDLFDIMKKDNWKMNKVSVVSALLAAAEMRELRKGIEIHEYAIQQRIDSDILVVTPLMTMYAKCGELEKVIELFRGLQEMDMVAWSAVIAALTQAGYPEEALNLFREMQYETLKPNRVTVASVLPACANMMAAKLGKSLHGHAIKANMDSGIVETALISMYAKCSLFANALDIFDRMQFKDTITWNALINGYVQIGDPYHTMEVFHKLQLSDVGPDSGTMVGILPACALLGDLDIGTCIHGQVIKYGFELDCHVKNALIDMYAKCRSLSQAEILFEEILAKDEVSWNAMIAGYLHNGLVKEARMFFYRMKSMFFRANIATVVSVLPTAAYLADLKLGMAIHAETIQMGFQPKTIVGNSLLDMYAKCGRLDYAEQIFDEMESKDQVSWNTMLAGFSLHGNGVRALECFSNMEENNVPMDSVSFVSVLSACRHGGLIEEGRKIFYIMSEKYNIRPNVEHYACMVDLLSRASLFDETLDLINSMHMVADARVWGALLGACGMHCNVKLAEVAISYLVKLEPSNPAHYVVLSGIYSQSGRWRDAGIMKFKINEKGLQKVPGCSWVDVAYTWTGSIPG